MTRKPGTSSLRFPEGWTKSVRSGLLHIVSLAQSVLTQARGKVVENGACLENERQRQEVALLREELRIKDARMAQVSPQRRPHYRPTERLAILELRAARGWSIEQTAEAFMLSPLTISSWMKRLDDDGPEGLLQTPQPVNKFPQFVGYAVQRLKTLCPALGKKKIAETS